MPPKTHDLVKLSSSANIILTNDQIDYLDLVNEFNLEARYPEEKFSFYKKCNKEYCEDNLSKIKELYLWLKSQL
jgi:hypothetical protein